MGALGARWAAWRGGQEEAGDLAALHARLVHGFEAQGGGWLWETDRHGRLTYLSAGIAARLAADGDALGRPLAEVFEAVGEGERPLRFHLNARASFADHEVRRAGGGGDGRCWSISGRPWFDEHGQFRGFVGQGGDLTEQRRSEAELARLARYDPLTGLLNRAEMRAALARALAGPPGAHRPAALLLVDLDRFKAVNDAMGHPAGDGLLQQVAARLAKVVGEAGLVGRLGGDEFEVVLPGEQRADRLEALAHAIIAAVSRPYFVKSSRVVVGCSVGIAVAPGHGADPETLIRNADLALYAAKGAGRGGHCFFRDALLAQARAAKALEDDLRGALADGQLFLRYQPVVCAASGRVSGFEALLRWRHPVRGLVPPSAFIGVAEETGLLDPIGEWALRTACAAAAGWPGDRRVAVNVSPVQFAKPSFAAAVAQALAASGLAPSRLELEITEGVFLDASPATAQMFAALKRLGVRLVLDDFGTGYCSLGYLRTAPVDKIKIDQSFVRGALAPGNRNAAIIKAIVTLADTLGMETTAEGVEAQDEVALIRDLGCSHVQGFVYGEPLAAEEADALAAQGGPVAPVGVKVSRAPRTATLRTATLRRGDREQAVRVRNLSATGAMVELGGEAPAAGEVLEIELGGPARRAEVRWVAGGRAGLHFTGEPPPPG